MAVTNVVIATTEKLKTEYFAEGRSQQIIMSLPFLPGNSFNRNVSIFNIITRFYYFLEAVSPKETFSL